MYYILSQWIMSVFHFVIDRRWRKWAKFEVYLAKYLQDNNHNQHLLPVTNRWMKTWVSIKDCMGLTFGRLMSCRGHRRDMLSQMCKETVDWNQYDLRMFENCFIGAKLGLRYLDWNFWNLWFSDWKCLKSIGFRHNCIPILKFQKLFPQQKSFRHQFMVNSLR